MQSAAEEHVQFVLNANLKRGMEYVGGKLKVTNEKLYFNPQPANIQKKRLVISVKEIKAIEKTKILGISPNGVLIHLKNDASYKFTIGMPWANKNQQFIDYINDLIT
ncbi:hypothetical protein JNUCC1_01638 [Lentibacillus sp. JNUCC-1]|uniref:GRAM domain-containing protein n=1 Tax=Lentibacillus sp. JNUCC-1 TaxID=2654513 RepID=UPI0012E8A7A0|nr:GRAM domain-containing protein [Lentibacillus sp. JNUCC-1]MUV37832.1 hypothetical protein [Lentibacillus sp. JNUCC-1]